jgi:hypothetical protein
MKAIVLHQLTDADYVVFFINQWLSMVFLISVHYFSCNFLTMSDDDGGRHLMSVS